MYTFYHRNGTFIINCQNCSIEIKHGKQNRNGQVLLHDKKKQEEFIIMEFGRDFVVVLDTPYQWYIAKKQGYLPLPTTVSGEPYQTPYRYPFNDTGDFSQKDVIFTC